MTVPTVPPHPSTHETLHDASRRELRDQVRRQQAHQFLRRRWLNSFFILLGAALGWVLPLVLLIWWQPDWWALRANWWWVLTFLVIQAGFLMSAKLLPGWGRGIVSELRGVTFSTAGVVSVAALTELMITHDWRALLVAAVLLPVAIVSQLLLRSVTKSLLLKLGWWGIRVVVYGAGLTGRKVLEGVREEPGLGYQVVAFFDDNPALIGTEVGGVPVVGPTTEWASDAPMAIVAMPGAPRGTQSVLLDGPLSVYRNVILIPELFDIQSLWTRSGDLGGMLGVQINHNLADPLMRRIKRLLSLLLVIGSAPFWVPVCSLVALLIWLEDRASPLYFQERLGLGGVSFKTWKFRTMVPNAEAVLQRHLAENPALQAEWDANFKLKRDPRITRVGGFLRKTSLDELPQLINVLKGEMALVGPRPLPAYHQHELPERVQRLRWEVRPGMTGLWQVSGRSDAGNEGMIRLDPYYIRNWSVWLDIVILMRTFQAVRRSAGAY